MLAQAVQSPGDALDWSCGLGVATASSVTSIVMPGKHLRSSAWQQPHLQPNHHDDRDRQHPGCAEVAAHDLAFSSPGASGRRSHHRTAGSEGVTDVASCGLSGQQDRRQDPERQPEARWVRPAAALNTVNASAYSVFGSLTATRER